MIFWMHGTRITCQLLKIGQNGRTEKKIWKLVILYTELRTTRHPYICPWLDFKKQFLAKMTLYVFAKSKQKLEFSHDQKSSWDEYQMTQTSQGGRYV